MTTHQLLNPHPTNLTIPFQVRIVPRLDTIALRAETLDSVTMHVRYGAPPDLLVPEVLRLCTDSDILAYATAWALNHSVAQIRADPWGCLGPIGRLHAVPEVVPPSLLRPY